MLTYLRFTRHELLALTQVCRPIRLSDDAFPSFRRLLLQALAAVPDLAARIASFQRYQLGILFEGLKERRHAEAARRGRTPGRGAARPPLTAGECQAVSQACGAFVLHGRFLSSFQGFLVRHFHPASPGLAGKLARLSQLQVEWLYGQVRRRRGPGA
jgi:hypothetical protein